jgi:hypothetical protein
VYVQTAVPTPTLPIHMPLLVPRVQYAQELDITALVAQEHHMAHAILARIQSNDQLFTIYLNKIIIISKLYLFSHASKYYSGSGDSLAT